MTFPTTTKRSTIENPKSTRHNQSNKKKNKRRKRIAIPRASRSRRSKKRRADSGFWGKSELG